MNAEMQTHAQQGVLPVAAHTDLGLVAELAASATPSPYGVASTAANDVREGYAAFEVIGGDADEDLHMLSSVSGLGGPEAAVFPTDRKVVAALVQRGVRPLGIATYGQTAEHSSMDGTALAVGGVVTAMLGHDGAHSRPYTVPGDTMELRVPLAETSGAYGLPNAEDTSPHAQIVPQSGAGIAADFVAMLHTLVDAGPLWRAVHTPKLRCADAANTALHNFTEAALAFVALGNGAISDNDVNGIFANVRRAPADPAVRVALALGVIPDRTGALDATAIANLRLRVLRTLFYDGTNPLYEIGYDAQRQTANARSANVGADGRHTPDDTSLGDLLSVQLNATTVAVAAFHDHTLDALSRVVGTARTHTSNMVAGEPLFTMAVHLGHT